MSIRMLQWQAQMINSDLDFVAREIHAPKKNLKLNEKSLNDSKKLLKDTIERQKNNIKFYEDDEKRYKILKKYGEVLHLVEKLLGLIPTDLANLSLEELEEKLKELMKTRKKNEMQLSFMFYQNLITDLMSNLLAIEKDFQEGKISSKQAYKHVQLSKQQIKDHALDMPAILRPAAEEAAHLVKLYENSYEKSNIKQTVAGESSIKDTELELKHEVMFDKLNNKTKEIMASVTSLSTDLSNFEPQVDLGDLNKKLKDTNSLLEVENFDVDSMKSSVEDLERTTISLTDKQFDLNKQNENLVSRIKESSSIISETSKISMKEISRETFMNISERSETNEITTEEIKELIQDEEKTPTTIGSQTANTILAQIDADKEFANKISIDPNADTSTLQLKKLEKSEDAAEILSEEVLTVEEKRELILTLKQELDEENPPQNNA